MKGSRKGRGRGGGEEERERESVVNGDEETEINGRKRLFKKNRLKNEHRNSKQRQKKENKKNLICQ